MPEIQTDDLLKQLIAASDISSFLAEQQQHQIDIPLSDFLNSLLEQKKLVKKSVIKKSELDANYAYQLFNGHRTDPSQDIVIQLAIGMSLNLAETQKLLHIAHKPPLYVKIKRDAVIIHAINESLDVNQTNELLHRYQLETLSHKQSK